MHRQSMRTKRILPLLFTCVMVAGGATYASSPLDWYNSQKEETADDTAGTSFSDQASGFGTGVEAEGSTSETEAADFTSQTDAADYTGETSEISASDYAADQVSLRMVEQKITSPLFGGAAVGRTMIPEGWTLSVTDLSIGTESVTCPDAVLVRAVSPDGSCELIFISKRSFKQEYMNMQGFEAASSDDQFDWSDLTHYLNYRDAGAVCDLMAGVIFGSGLTPTGEIPLTQEESETLANLRAAYDTEIKNQVATLANSGLQIGEVVSTDVTGAAKTYSDGADQITVRSASNGFELYAEGYGFYTDTIWWDIPQVYMIRTPAADHDAYREVFDVFCAGTRVSQEYEQMREQHSQQLQNMIMQARNNGYQYSYSQSDSDYDSLGDSTVDKGDTYSAFDAWDDVIRDQTDYTTGDGSHVKIPNSYDHVFEGDDGTIYAGNALDGPAGSTELSPTQVGY